MYYIIIFILSILSAVASNAQPQRALPDTISLGYDIQVSSRTDSRSVTGVDSKAFEYSTAIDVTKSLYGKIAGLNVLQGSGSSADNVSSLLLRGHEPLVLVDGFPRSLADITSEEMNRSTCLLMQLLPHFTECVAAMACSWSPPGGARMTAETSAYSTDSD